MKSSSLKQLKYSKLIIIAKLDYIMKFSPVRLVAVLLAGQPAVAAADSGAVVAVMTAVTDTCCADIAVPFATYSYSRLGFLSAHSTTANVKEKRLI